MVSSNGSIVIDDNWTATIYCSLHSARISKHNFFAIRCPYHYTCTTYPYTPPCAPITATSIVRASIVHPRPMGLIQCYPMLHNKIPLLWFKLYFNNVEWVARCTLFNFLVWYLYFPCLCDQSIHERCVPLRLSNCHLLWFHVPSKPRILHMASWTFC